MVRGELNTDSLSKDSIFDQQSNERIGRQNVEKSFMEEVASKLKTLLTLPPLMSLIPKIPATMKKPSKLKKMKRPLNPISIHSESNLIPPNILKPSILESGTVEATSQQPNISKPAFLNPKVEPKENAPLPSTAGRPGPPIHIHKNMQPVRKENQNFPTFDNTFKYDDQI